VASMRPVGGFLVAVLMGVASGCAGARPSLRPASGLVLGGAGSMATGGRASLAQGAPPTQGDDAAIGEQDVGEAEGAGAQLDPELAKDLAAARPQRSARDARVHHAAVKAASRATAKLSPVRYSPPRKRGRAIARRASRLVGVSTLRKVTRRLPDDCTGLVRIAAEPEGVVLFDGNARVSDNGVTAIWRRARARGALHKRRPRPGDLVFFRETYDRNRDGRRNDGLTHIAVVERVASDGTVTFVHRGGKGVSRSRMNLWAPRDKKRNDYLRAAGQQTRAYLTAELFSTYASPDKL